MNINSSEGLFSPYNDTVHLLHSQLFAFIFPPGDLTGAGHVVM